MQIGPEKAVTIAYTLKDDQGEVLDSSEGGDPLVYLHGAGNIVPGLEEALEGKKVGDVVNATLAPEKAYGERDEGNIRNLPVRKLPDKKAKVGMRFRFETEHGSGIGVVTAVKGDFATVDTNHPLAGMTLHFEVKVLEVRDATDEEKSHGHIHGPGHHH